MREQLRPKRVHQACTLHSVLGRGPARRTLASALISESMERGA